LLLAGIETGMRWGELIALRPRHLDTEQCLIVVRETIVEISKKNSPTGQRYQVKPYPKSNKPRVIKIGQELTGLIADRIARMAMGPDDLLFPSTDRDLRQPTSRNTFRTRSWQPAVKAAGFPTGLRMHDLRHAHASWLLAGGADLKTVMDRLGHARIATTQQYLHALAGADDTALEAFRRTRDGHRHRPPGPEWEPDPGPEPSEIESPGL
jgi:integrase